MSAASTATHKTSRLNRRQSDPIWVCGDRANSLQNVSVSIPKRRFMMSTCVFATVRVSLVPSFIPADARSVLIGQGVIRGSRGRTTTTDMFDSRRTAFAKPNGVKPAQFGANSKGPGSNLDGAGRIHPDPGIIARVATPCEVSDGQCLSASVVEFQFGGSDISKFLAMAMVDADECFGAGQAPTFTAHTICKRLIAGLRQPVMTHADGIIEPESGLATTAVRFSSRDFRPSSPPTAPRPRGSAKPSACEVCPLIRVRAISRRAARRTRARA